jgi:hypothetical protein
MLPDVLKRLPPADCRRPLSAGGAEPGGRRGRCNLLMAERRA